MEDMNKENMIEWFTGQRHIGVTLSDPTYIRKVKELAKKYPDKVKIKAENKDGTIYAHLPKSALKLSIIKREMSEEARQKAAERMKNLHQKTM
jgi:hypothetical protein